jgi:hypothetical protein
LNRRLIVLCSLVGLNVLAAVGAANADPVSPGLIDGLHSWAFYVIVDVEILVALAEATAYRLVVRMRWRSALCASVVANAISLVVGIRVAVECPNVFDYLSPGQSYVVGLCLALAVEAPIVMAWYWYASKRRAPASQGATLSPTGITTSSATMWRLFATVAAANAMTFLFAESGVSILARLLSHGR